MNWLEVRKRDNGIYTVAYCTQYIGPTPSGSMLSDQLLAIRLLKELHNEYETKKDIETLRKIKAVYKSGYYKYYENTDDFISLYDVSKRIKELEDDLNT
jgi:hypothetical protein